MTLYSRFEPRHRARQVLCGGVAIALCAAARLQGQVTPSTRPSADRIPGHVVRGDSISAAVARTQCVALGDALYTEDVRELGACRVTAFDTLPSAGGDAWAYAVYAHRWLVPSGPIVETTPRTTPTPADTVGEIELVLLRRTRLDPTRSGQAGGALTPVWHYRVEAELVRSVLPTAVTVADGSALFAIDECVNGTGGCAQRFVAYRAGNWRNIRSVFLDSLARRFPGAVQHGFHVDLSTLRANAALYSPNDANCCPSRGAELTLGFRNDALEMTGLRVRTMRDRD